MEERIQGGLKEGAGLEESRLNTEFIDFLRKWSTPVLMLIAILAGGYFLYNKFQASQDAALAKAFADFDAAVVSRNPESLIRVAEEQGGKAAVPMLARLAAADLYLESSRTGIPAGIQLDQAGALPEGTALLSDEDRTGQLGKAAAQYEAVVKATAGEEGMEIHTITGLFGLAAVAESRGEMDKAREHYTKLIEVADAVGFTRESAAAKKRIETLPSLETMPKIYAQSDLFIVKSAVNPIQVKTADGSVVTVEGAGTGAQGVPLKPPTGTGTPVPDATSSPFAPAPTPAPAPEPGSQEPGSEEPSQPQPEPAPGR